MLGWRLECLARGKGWHTPVHTRRAWTCGARGARAGLAEPYRVTSLIRKRTPPSTLPWAYTYGPRGFLEGGRFLMGEVPLHVD